MTLDAEITQLVSGDRMSMRDICSLHDLLFGDWPDTTGSLMTCCRVWPAAEHGCDPGIVAHRMVEWAVSVGRGSYTLQISQRPCLLRDAMVDARDAVVAQRRLIADRFVTYPATKPTTVGDATAELIAELGWAWWRWEMPEVRVVAVGHEWDTLAAIWVAAE